MEFTAFSGYQAYTENKTNQLYVAPRGSREGFDACLTALAAEGFEAKELYTDEIRSYAALQRGKTGVFLNYFPKTGDLRAAVEEDCAYFSFTDEILPAVCTPQITQVSLEDYGMSYAVRLSDGRFLLFDGGWNFAPDADRLYQCLTEGSLGKKPRIAAWILTHPHRDHYQCFIGFMKRYGTAVTVENVLLTFPEADDPAFDRDFLYVDPRVPDSDERANIPRMWAEIARCGAAVCSLHTGQRYRIGDASLEVLSSLDDALESGSTNAMSAVLRMELGGQVILWTADSSFGTARLGTRYGTYLKADILQVPHHGFQSGSAEAELAGYPLVSPRVCLLPVSEYHAFTSFCIHRESTGFLMRRCGVEEIIAGGPHSRTISLPYIPSPAAKELLAARCAEGLRACGSKCWIFTGLSTARAEDFVFDFLNTTFLRATVNAEIFFEDKTQRILHIRISVPSASTHRICVVGEDVDKDAVWFNEYALKTQPIPEHAPFALRFTCDIPLVISHPNHTPTHAG